MKSIRISGVILSVIMLLTAFILPACQPMPTENITSNLLPVNYKPFYNAITSIDYRGYQNIERKWFSLCTGKDNVTL